MPASMAEQLEEDMACEGLLECVHGLKDLDEECFRTLVGRGEPMTIDQVAEAVDRERSTAYRSVQRLLETGLIEKEQVNYDQGGYYHVYYPVDPARVASDTRRLLDEWYAKMNGLLEEFEEKYANAPEGLAQAER